MKKDGVNGTCSTHGGDECIQILVRKVKDKRPLWTARRDGRIILKRNLTRIVCEGKD
jgi:hypothetical protein